MKKIQSFTDLEAWQKSHVLVVGIYKTANTFPAEERYGLASQMKRAAVSITSNIAEGFGRRSAKEKGMFYATATASLIELQNQLLVSRTLGILSRVDFKVSPKRRYNVPS